MFLLRRTGCASIAERGSGASGFNQTASGSEAVTDCEQVAPGHLVYTDLGQRAFKFGQGGTRLLRARLFDHAL